MKRLTIPLIIITIILASLACGQSSTATKEPTVEVINEETTTADTTEIEEETTEATEDIPQISNEVSLEEQVVFDQEGITITVKGLDLEDSFFGPEISVLIENNYDKDITVQIRNISINDVMVDAFFSSDCSSWEKSQ